MNTPPVGPADEEPLGSGGHNLFEVLAERALAHADQPAWVCGEESLSHARLLDACWHARHVLQRLGVRPGDRVALTLAPGAAWVSTLFACLALGAVCAPLNPRLPATALQRLLQDLQPARLVGPAEAQAWGLGRPGGPHAGASHHGVLQPRDDEPALILYTSGTQALPKGVMLSQRHLARAARGIQQRLPVGPQDRILSALPLHHSYGLMQLLVGLGQGATLCLQPQAVFAGQLLRAMEAHAATVLPATPSLLSLLAGDGRADTACGRSLRVITCASDALPAALAARVRARWPDARLLPLYGQTECIRISMPEADDAQAAPASVGRGMPGLQVWLVDDHGRRLAPGASGELVVHGEHVMLGYWRRPEETAQALRPGTDDPTRTLLHTGDRFRTDALGRLYFLGRGNDIIKSGGEKVGPVEVEAVLLEHPDVADAAVVGSADARLGQAVHAFVVPRPGHAAAPAELMDHCRQHLPPSHWPRAFTRLDHLPRNAMGKVQRHLLTPE